jgi:hypothetical protein
MRYTLMTAKNGVSSSTLKTRNGRRGSLVRVILKVTLFPEDVLPLDDALKRDRYEMVSKLELLDPSSWSGTSSTSRPSC